MPGRERNGRRAGANAIGLRIMMAECPGHSILECCEVLVYWCVEEVEQARQLPCCRGH